MNDSQGIFPRRRGCHLRSSGGRAFASFWGLLAALVVFLAPAVHADPDLEGLILPGLDPLLRGTDNPRLLGVDRIILREKLLAQGIDPTAGPVEADLGRLMRERSHRLIDYDPSRMITLVETGGSFGVETVFRYPESFFLFQSAQELPGGFLWYPPRPVDDPLVDLFIDDVGSAVARRRAVLARTAYARMLDIGSAGMVGTAGGGLINLTIPIKLPRTLEKIIGRGEKTNIKISGREHISISGETTTSNRFTPTETRKSQSLFPSLDMEQQLQLNLSGQIGEKIFIEVDHNSEAMGPEATKIRLTYQGTEDEVIQTIETGDVGLTLPGSALLGYSSNKSGLFGVKVTGQVGRADFTVVASKQEAESASKQFNSKGGTLSDHVIEAWRYLNNRFFRLDLQPSDPLVSAFYEPDFPGRPAGTTIDLNTVQIFRFMGSVTQQTGDIRNVVAVLDTAGVWDNAYRIWLNDQLETPTDIAFEYGDIWRPVQFDLLTDIDGNVVAVDLRNEYGRSDILAVIYDVIDAAGERVYRVGDFPNQDEDSRVEIGPGEAGTKYYRMKLLKPQDPEPYTWQYVLRNIYPLGGSNIDPETFEFRIEANTPTDFPNLDLDFSGAGSRLEWFRIFGLDQVDAVGAPGHDDVADGNDPDIFKLQDGLLMFPLNLPFPFAADSTVYRGYADSDDFVFARSFLSSNLMPEIYDPATTEQDLAKGTKFLLVAAHAAASSSFNLGASNIEEGSETVILDGQTLVRDVDYEIDYLFGEITLKGDKASSMTPDSQISVNYQYAPFLGGGNSNLLGFNLGYDLGEQNRLSTTWLYETNSIVGYKPKLGEEPSRTLVGNINGQLTAKPYFLTHVANFISRVDSERESTVQVNGEVAMSFPNPNTQNKVYLEDFEGIDSSDVLPVSRLTWSEASLPRHGEDTAYAQNPLVADDRVFAPDDRVTTRWFLPRENVLRRYLNPTLKEQEGREVQQSLQIFMRADDGQWDPQDWGGVMKGMGRSGVDLTQAQFLEFWVNDFEAVPELRRGTLHFDFGIINEDFYWPVDPDSGELILDTFDQEDRDRNGVFMIDEDTGLGDDPAADRFSADYVGADDPYPWINGTAGNNREDSEDLDGDSNLDKKDGFFTLRIDLADSALVDVLRDYDSAIMGDNIAKGLAWRKYRVRLGDALEVLPRTTGTTPNLAAVTHVRIWFEDVRPDPGDAERMLQLSDIKFVGSRWEREGIRWVGTAESPYEEIVDPADRGVNENFFIGEVNNKENPDYVPPFPVREENRIPEKEQSMVLNFQDLEKDHMVRVSKVVSTQGDDYTAYNTISWYVYNPDQALADLDIAFRVGADTLNYYEVSTSFEDGDRARIDWRELKIDVAELSNAKLGEVDPETGWVFGEVHDLVTGEPYQVRVVGAPDLRRVKRYYVVVGNNRAEDLPASGYFYINAVMLREVKRESGMAERIAMSLNMADVIRADFDWSRTDSDFHGLNSNAGKGYTDTDWSFSTNFRVNDFIPLLGFNMPVNVGRQVGIQRPKYLTNSDIEILDEDLRNDQSTIDKRENFSVRLMHPSSKWAPARYLIDPWAFSLSGSRAETDSPLNKTRRKSLTGSITYDLRIPGKYHVGDYLFLGKLPVVKSVAVLPNKISLSGNFSGTQTRSQTYYADTEEFEDRPTTKTRRGTLKGTLDYNLLPFVDVGVTVNSERDLFRERWLLGLNIGEENTFTQSVQMKFLVPKKLGLPDFVIFKPVQGALRALQKIKPSVTYNGGFGNAHSPSIRQPGDPENIRSVSNNGDWNLRGTLPLDDFFDSILPSTDKMSDSRRRALIETERKRKQRNRRTGRAAADTAASDANLSDAEKLRLEEKALLEAAREREEQSEGGLAEDAPAEDQGGGVRIPNPLTPLMKLLRNTNPMQFSYSKRAQSAYTRMTGNTSFWYKVGLLDHLDLPDTSYAVSQLKDSRNMSLSSGFKLARTANLDVEFRRVESAQTTSSLETKSLQQDWPDLQLSMSGLERWGIFGGGGEDGRLRSANLNLGYKYSKSVSGYTETFYNPKRSVSILPRLNMTFRSGLSASVSVSHVKDRTEQNGSLTLSRQMSVSTQIRHSFRAEGFLAKLGLYKPGNIPTVNLDVDISYNRSTTDRWLPTSDREEESDTATGRSTISVNPRMSYNITRNLSGAVRLIYSRSKTFETDLVTQTVGLGVEATFVF